MCERQHELPGMSTSASRADPAGGRGRLCRGHMDGKAFKGVTAQRDRDKLSKPWVQTWSKPSPAVYWPSDPAWYTYLFPMSC